MTKPSAQVSEPDEVKRLTDYVDVAGGTQFEGEKVSSEEVLGEEFKLIDFAVLPSKMGSEGSKFLVLQIELKGKVCVTTTGAAQVVRAVQQMPKQYLPVNMKIVKELNPDTKRHYYRVE